MVNSYPAQADGVVAYVSDEGNRLYAVRNTDEFRNEPVGSGEIGGAVAFSPSGYALAWRYRGKTVAVLSPTGRVIGQVDTETVVARDAVEKANIAIQCARIDESRGLWFIGTSHGLAVGSLDPVTKQPATLLHRGDCLGLAGVRLVESFLGRVLIVTDGDEKGSDGGVLLENGFGLGRADAKAFATRTRFSTSPVTQAMGKPSAATMVAPDVVWITAFGGVWQWTPSGWQHLGLDFNLPRPHETRWLPVVVTDLLHEQLWCIRPRAVDRFREMAVANAPLTTALNYLCADPSGGGVWAWDTTASPPDLGYLRFVTPHAVTDTRPEGTRHPATFRVARLTHRRADGMTKTPVARNDSVLLPVGADMLLGRAGHWVETDLSALAGGPFTELTPGAGSAEAAWLAIRRDGKTPQRLVTIEIDENDSDSPRPRLAVTEHDPQVPAAAQTALVPDSSGTVWFAWNEGQRWTLRRIQVTGLGATLHVDSLSEPPRFLFLNSVAGWLGDGLLVTDTGGCRIAHADRLGAAPGGFQLLSPEVKPWVRLWQPDPLDPDPRFEYEFVLSRRWGSVAGDARVVLLRRSSRNPRAAAYGVTFEGQSPRIESAAARLDSTPLWGFQPRLWFTGSNEYVTGGYDPRPRKPSRLLALPVNGVPAVRSADWLKQLVGDLDPDLGTLVPDLAVNTRGDGSAITLVVADGRRVGFEDLSALAKSLVIVPTVVEVYFGRGGKPQTYDVRRGMFTSPLPATATHLTVRVAPNYGDWWRPDWERVSLRDRASPSEEAFPLSPDGLRATFQVPLTAGGHRELALATDAWPDPVSNELPNLSVDVATLPVGVNAWWLLVALFGGVTGIGIAVTVSPEFYHRVVGLFGGRWVFAGGDGNASVIIRSDGDGGASIRRTVVATYRPTTVPPSPSDLRDLTDNWRADAEKERIDPFLVTAYVDESLFRHNWGSCLSDPWTDSTARIHAGTIFGVGPDDTLPDFPLRRGNMLVTALGCEIRTGDDHIPMRDLIVNRTLEAFRGSGFQTRGTPINATRADLVAALKESDICLVVAHAKDGSFRFAESDFGSAEWRELHGSVQCRFLIVVGCGLGDLATPSNPLLFDVLRQGVTCLACTQAEQDVWVAMQLLPRFCAEWRRGRTSGPTVALALRRAAASILSSADAANAKGEINSYVLLGTPTLQLAFRRTTKGTRS
jgi:hypothetical protein